MLSQLKNVIGNQCADFADVNTGFEVKLQLAGGGVIAEVAMYEKDTLHYDLKTANANADTLYVLQGRDENGMRSFRNSNATLRLGQTEEKLFANEDNQTQLDYMIQQNMTVADAINTFAVKTAAEDSPLHIKTGFFASYGGYHTVD